MLVPDELAASGLGLTDFAKGDLVYVKQETVFPVAGAGVHPVAAGVGLGGANAGESCYHGGTGSVDATGVLTTQGGSSETTRLSKPLIVLGRHAGLAVMAACQAGVPLTKIAISDDRAAAFTRHGAAIALAASTALRCWPSARTTSARGGGGKGALIRAIANALGPVNSRLACRGVRTPLRVVSSDGYATAAGRTLNPG